MTTHRLVIWITFLAVFAMAARVSMDTDSWWHLRTGEHILETGRIARVDSFSYTRGGEPYHAPGWAVQIPMVWIFWAGGPGLLNIWVAGMVVLAYSFVHRAMEGGPFLKAFIIVLAASAAGVFWAARPYMVTFVLSAVFLWILEDWRNKRRDRLLWLLPLMVLWVNSHGGFFTGYIFWGVYFTASLVDQVLTWFKEKSVGFGPEIRRIALIGVLLLPATALNPFGIEMLAYPFQTINITALRDYIQEWQPPNFHQLQVWPFPVMVFLILGFVGASKKGIRLEDFLLVTGWGLFSLFAGRNISIFSLGAAVVLSRHAGPVLSKWGENMGLRLRFRARVSRPMAVLNWALLVTVALAVAVKTYTVYPEEVNFENFSDFLPLDAADYLDTNRPQGRLFNTYNWGAYLLYRLPDYQVFVDGRTDLYRDEIIDVWFEVARAEGDWSRILDEYGVNLVLIEPDLPLADALDDADWRRAFEDDVAVIFTRNP